MATVIVVLVFFSLSVAFAKMAAVSSLPPSMKEPTQAVHDALVTAACGALANGTLPRHACCPKRRPSMLKRFCELKRAFSSVKLEPPQHFASCAVVSSSPDLMRHSFGAEIDSHATVIRVNHAPIGGEFAPFAGSRESVRFIAARESFLYGPGEKRLMAKLNATLALPHQVLVVPMMGDKRVWPKVLRDRNLTNPQLKWAFVTDGEKLGFRLARFLGFASAGRTTTGAVALLVALSVCESITAYSFQPPTKSSFSHMHHYFRRLFVSNASHDSVHKTMPWEHELWADLSTSRREQALVSGRVHLPGFACVSCMTGSTTGGNYPVRKARPHGMSRLPRAATASGLGARKRAAAA